MSGKTSVFTTIVRDEGRVFAENDTAFAFLTNIPIMPGHALVSPKRVVETVEEMTDDELKDVFLLMHDVKRALKHAVGAKGFNCAWNEGKEYGQSVPHVHFHIVPRTKGDGGIAEYEPRSFLYRPGSRSATPNDELKDIARLLERTIEGGEQ